MQRVPKQIICKVCLCNLIISVVYLTAVYLFFLCTYFLYIFKILFVYHQQIGYQQVHISFSCLLTCFTK